MEDSRKGQSDLAGKEVEIFLKTPLFRFRYVFEKKERELLDNAVRLSGVVLCEKSAGLLIKVRLISNMKKIEDKLPFQQIFIPYGKIDFMVVE